MTKKQQKNGVIDRYFHQLHHIYFQNIYYLLKFITFEIIAAA